MSLSGTVRVRTPVSACRWIRWCCRDGRGGACPHLPGPYVSQFGPFGLAISQSPVRFAPMWLSGLLAGREDFADRAPEARDDVLAREFVPLSQATD